MSGWVGGGVAGRGGGGESEEVGRVREREWRVGGENDVVEAHTP